MIAAFCSFVRDEGGRTAVEYGLAVAIISVLIIAVVDAVCYDLRIIFDTVHGGFG